MHREDIMQPEEMFRKLVNEGLNGHSFRPGDQASARGVVERYSHRVDGLDQERALKIAREELDRRGLVHS